MNLLSLKKFLPGPTNKLGKEFDTEWARRRPAIIVREIIIQLVTKPVINLFATPTVVGIENLNELDTPAIYVANHSSHLDTSVLYTALPNKMRRKMTVAARDDYFFDKWWKAVLWSLWMNVVPIERDKASRRSILFPQQLLADGWNFALYPEGSRGADDYLTEFKPGAAYLAIRAKVPIVPVYIKGTRKVFAPYTHKIHPGKTKVVFGKAIYAEQEEKPHAFIKRVERAVEFAADVGNTNLEEAQFRYEQKQTPSLFAPTQTESRSSNAQEN